MSEEENAKSVNITTYVIYAVAFFVLYVLSIGPVLAVLHRFQLHSIIPAVQIFYYPILLLWENELAAELLNWYIDLWVGVVIQL